MDAFTSFFDSQSSSRNRWTYESLKNFRQISPVVQNHLKLVNLNLWWEFHSPFGYRKIKEEEESMCVKFLNCLYILGFLLTFMSFIFLIAILWWENRAGRIDCDF